MPNADDCPVDAADLLSRLAAFLAGRGLGDTGLADAYLVGGALRDAMLGRPYHDIDLAVAGSAQPIGRAVADFLGGALVPAPAYCWNVARIALRIPDGAGVRASQSHFIIDLAGYDGAFADDLRRRDFTVNAMGLPLESWHRHGDSPAKFDDIIDPLNGRGDLARRVLRMTGDGVFAADPARLARAVRLAGQLGFRIEPATAGAIRRDAHLIDRAAPERIRDEFLSILAGDGAKARLEILDRLDLLCRIIPELAATRHCPQPRAHHYWDVWGHLLHCVEYAEAVTAGHRSNAIYTMAPWTAAEDAHFAAAVGDGHNRRTILKLAALLHDIAKPPTRAPDAEGRIRFLGHHQLGAKMAAERLGALRCAGAVTGLVAAMTRYHLRPGQIREDERMPSRRAIYRYYRDVGDAAVDTLYLSMADFLAARGPELDPEKWANYARMIAVILETGAAQPPAGNDRRRTLVNGHDLMDALHIPPGPRIGALLEQLREAEAVGEIASRDEALALAAQLLAQLDAAD